MEDEKKVIFPLYLQYDNHVFCIMNSIKTGVVFQNKKAYEKDGKIWVFSKTAPSDSKYPYFWYEHGDLCFGKIRDQVKDVFVLDKCVDISLVNTVFRTPEDKQLYNEDVLSDMNATSNVFTPIINPNDDFLKKLVKMAILEKKVPIAKYKAKLNRAYELSNLMTALRGDTKMSVKNFLIWMDLLQIDVEVCIRDNGTDYQNPLNKMIIYDSATDKYEMQ